MDLKFKTIHLKYETLKINFVVNIFVIFYKLKILSVLIYLLKKGKVRVE